METMMVVIDAAPCVKCDQANYFLDIGFKKYLEDLEVQGVCVAEVPKSKEWEIELNRPEGKRKYHLPRDDEWSKVKSAKIVNEVYYHASPSEMRLRKNKEAVNAAIEKSNTSKKKSKKVEPEKPQEKEVSA